jgi:hypothetical protein
MAWRFDPVLHEVLIGDGQLAVIGAAVVGEFDLEPIENTSG